MNHLDLKNMGTVLGLNKKPTKGIQADAACCYKQSHYPGLREMPNKNQVY
jgi:hypothetical protein